MASPRFNGQGFTNPTNPLGLHSENRYRDESPLSNSFMSNEVKMAENARGNQEFQVPLVGTGVKAGVKKGFLKGFTGGVGELFRRGAGKGVKGIVGEGGEEAAEVTAKKLATANAKALVITAKNPAKKTMIRTAGVVVVGIYGMGLLGDNADTLVDSWTGGDCDEKALALGHEEGTTEYQNSVEECQNKAGNTMMLIGGSIILVGGLIVFMLIKPKKSAE